MEAALHLLRGGGDRGSGSSEVSDDESTVFEGEGMEKNYLGQSEEESSFSGEVELELGLGLSIGGGGRVKAGGWSERGFSSSSSSSSRVSIRAAASSVMAVSGTKRAADPVSREGESPTGFSQVVGWPPIRAYRMNSLVNQAGASRGQEDKRKLEDDLKKKKKKESSSTAEVKSNPGFVKVNMDGVLIGRKLDLNAHSSYQSLSQIVHHMFFRPTSHSSILPRLMDGSSEFVLTYEDKDGDWMLVGDVPWRMFVESVKKLRIMRTAEAKGLSPRREVVKLRK